MTIGVLGPAGGRTPPEKRVAFIDHSLDQHLVTIGSIAHCVIQDGNLDSRRTNDQFSTLLAEKCYHS
jgi:hypothetical protein